VLNLAVIPVEAAAQVRPDIVDCRVFGEQREELFRVEPRVLLHDLKGLGSVQVHAILKFWGEQVRRDFKPQFLTLFEVALLVCVQIGFVNQVTFKRELYRLLRVLRQLV
jgi:hypothetical protein